MVRRRWLWVTLAAVVVGLTLGWRPLTDLRQRRQADSSLAGLSVCLLGVGAEEAAEPAKRLRAVAVAASIDGSAATWPRRCESWMTRFRRDLGVLRAGREASCGAPGCCQTDRRCQTIEALRAEAARGAELIDRGHSETFDADRMWSLALQLGLGGGDPGGARPAPEPALLLDPAAMQPLYRGDYLRLLTDPAGDDRIELLFYELERRYGQCSLDMKSDTPARCRPLPEAIPVGLAGELFAAEAGAPARMFAQGPEEGSDGHGWVQALFDVQSGERLGVVAQRPSGGFVWRDGSFARLGMEAPMAEMSLYRVTHGVADAPVPLAAGEGSSLGPQLVWDEVVWAKPTGAGRHRLFARHLSPTGLGEIGEIGETVPIGDSPVLDLCRNGKAIVMLLLPWVRGEAPLATLVFRTADGWQPPSHLRLGAGKFGFTCQGETATFSWTRALDESPDHDAPPRAALPSGAAQEQAVRGRYEVHRLRCGPRHCEHGRAVVMLSRYSPSSRLVAGDLGAATVVMWRSPLGDVRMRVGTLEALPTARDIPVFDDLEHGGFDWDLERDPIFGRAGGALVLISRQIDETVESATYGLRVHSSGEVRPVAVDVPAADATL